jgi:hypothetical protein
MNEKFIPEENSICKPTDKRIIWDNIKFHNLDWDVEIRGLPYQCVTATYYPDGIPDPKQFPYSLGVKLNHCLGGNFGENNYYVYPLFRESNPKRGIRDDVEYILEDPGPTKDNLIEYNGRSVCWSIAFEETNYFRKGEIREGGLCTIFRNGKKFYEIGAREMQYGLSKAQYFLMQLQEHPINFWSRKWRDELIDRKIWYNSDPCIIRSIIEDQGCIMIEPDREYTKLFRPSPWQIDADDVFDPLTHYNGGEDIKADYLDPHINWFRNDANTKLFVIHREGIKNRILERLEKIKSKVSEEVYLELHKAAFEGL